MAVHKIVIQTTVLIQTDTLEDAKTGIGRELPDLRNAVDGIVEATGYGFVDSFEIVTAETLTDEALEAEMATRDHDNDYFD